MTDASVSNPAMRCQAICAFFAQKPRRLQNASKRRLSDFLRSAVSLYLQAIKNAAARFLASPRRIRLQCRTHRVRAQRETFQPGTRQRLLAGERSNLRAVRCMLPAGRRLMAGSEANKQNARNKTLGGQAKRAAKAKPKRRGEHKGGKNIFSLFTFSVHMRGADTYQI